ncbi:MAG: hypothetical protein NTZ17_13705 [Phycisphaerae bacterium]|nr:hypothetical protein [Phycisphaerae bacterium]
MERSRSRLERGKTTPARHATWGPQRWLARLGLPAMLALLAACSCESQQDDAMANAYYLSPNKDLRRLGRIALVEMDAASSSPEIAAAVTDSLFLETQKKQVFGVMVVRRDDPMWQSLQENLDSLQALRQLVAVREALNCNGLLVGTVTRYQPYPHMVLGLRLKLLDLTDGQLLWGMEQVWDSADRSIQKRIKTYLKDQRRSEQSGLHEELVVVSPLTFCKFVAYEVAGTFERAKTQ